MVYIVSNEVSCCNFETPMDLSLGVDFVGNLPALTANLSYHVEHYIDLKFPEHLMLPALSWKRFWNSTI